MDASRPVIRLRIARLAHWAADKLDPPGFEYRIDFRQPGDVLDWSKARDELAFMKRRTG